MKTLLVFGLALAFYVAVGLIPHAGPLAGSTALVVMPVTQIGALVGWATLGALTYKGIASLCLLGFLAKRIR